MARETFGISTYAMTEDEIKAEIAIHEATIRSQRPYCGNVIVRLADLKRALGMEP